MLVRFRETAAGLQGSLVETRRIDGKVRYEHVASFGSVPAPPSVADRIALWRRVYETLAELADRIDAETQGKIISAVHSRIRTPRRKSYWTSCATRACRIRRPRLAGRPVSRKRPLTELHTRDASANSVRSPPSRNR